jgi:ribonuclease HI
LEDVKGKRIIGESNKTKELAANEIARTSWPVATWIPPDQGWLKLNVDTSFIDATGHTCTRAVVKNHKGEVIISAWHLFFDCQFVEEAEFAACYEGLRLVVEWCQGPIILESDNITCIRSLSSDEWNHSSWAPWISDLREYMSRINQIKFQHVKRSQNPVAHELSQHDRQVCKFFRSMVKEHFWV